MSGRFMLDLETLGKTSGSVIVSLGAVRFSRERGIEARYYERIDAQSAVDAGLTMDASTVLWWLERSPVARAELTAPGAKPIMEVLENFDRFLNSDGKPAEVWGCGARFDNELLEAAYRAIKCPTPWPYCADRCYRTLKATAPHIKIDRSGGEHHHALHDAEAQARHLLAIEADMRRAREVADAHELRLAQVCAGTAVAINMVPEDAGF